MRLRRPENQHKSLHTLPENRVLLWCFLLTLWHQAGSSPPPMPKDSSLHPKHRRETRISGIEASRMKAFKLRNTERRSQEKCAEKCAIRKPLKMEQHEIDHGSISLTMTRHAERSRSVNNNNSSGENLTFSREKSFPSACACRRGRGLPEAGHPRECAAFYRRDALLNSCTYTSEVLTPHDARGESC